MLPTSPLTILLLKTVSPVASLPTEILEIILSYLTFLDRFRLKMAGNHQIRNAIRNIPRPLFSDYIAHYITLPPIKPAYINNELVYNEQLCKIIIVACEAGHNALVFELLNAKLKSYSSKMEAKYIFGQTDLLLDDLLGQSLAAATIGSQFDTMKMLLELLPKGPQILITRKQQSSSKTREIIISRALSYAAWNDDQNILKLLLKCGAETRSNLHAIAFAAQRGHREIIKTLSKRILWKRGRKLSDGLNYAVAYGQQETIKLLLDKGAHMRNKTSGHNSLHIAALNGYENIVRLLLLRGAKDTYVAPWFYQRGHRTGMSHNWCSLHFAVLGKHYNLIEFLLENKIMPSDQMDSRGTALPLAAALGDCDILKLLLKYGFDVSTRLNSQTGLHLAVQFGNTNMVTLLLDVGANINSQTQSTHETYYNASTYRKAERINMIPSYDEFINKDSAICDTLHEFNIEIQSPETEGNTPTKHAIYFEREDCLSALLKSGANTEIPCATEQNDLYYAIRHRRVNLIALLGKYGVDLEKPYRYFPNMTPLQKAAIRGDKALVDSLLTSGANKYARDGYGETALHHAVESGSWETISTLLDWGVDINAVDNSKRSCLHTLALSKPDDSFLFDRLTARGADPLLEDKHGKTASETKKERSAELWERERERESRGYASNIGGGCG